MRDELLLGVQRVLNFFSDCQVSERSKIKVLFLKRKLEYQPKCYGESVVGLPPFDFPIFNISLNAMGNP